MTVADLLTGLTGKPRRAAYLRLKQAENEHRRALARRPTRHALVIRGMIHAQMLPAPGVDGLTADERCRVRNQLKALRRTRHAR